MNYYPHHIGYFNSATRHLTRVERSLYRELIELYYDTEQASPADDFDRLARRVIAQTDKEKDGFATYSWKVRHEVLGKWDRNHDNIGRTVAP